MISAGPRIMICSGFHLDRGVYDLLLEMDGGVSLLNDAWDNVSNTLVGINLQKFTTSVVQLKT